MNHEDRVKAMRDGFANANAQLIAEIEALDDTAATKKQEEGWNPAQIGWHVALTNEFLSGVISGGVPQMAVPRPADFTESLATLQLPQKVKTFSQLEPPESASKGEAVERLQASANSFSKAADTVTSDRCQASVIQMPFGTVFSIYEVGEFVAVHVHRHIGQLKRTIGKG